MIMDFRDLQPGDVLNSIADPKMPLHWPIAAGTDNPFVHVAMFERDTTAISALPDGVQRRPLEKWDRFMLVTRFPYRLVALAALQEAVRMIGTPYDFMGLAIEGVERVTGIDLPDGGTDRLTCAHLVVEAFRRCGANIVPGIADGDVTPRDLVENSTLEVVGYLRIR
jgi:uncharacterized protein YycO